MDAKTISFTAEEAIAIAANLANKHLNQSDQDNSENIWRWTDLVILNLVVFYTKDNQIE